MRWAPATTGTNDCLRSRSGRCRIVHVTQGLEIGGQEKLLVEFARHADRDRFDLMFLCLGTEGPLGEEIRSQGWPVLALEERGGVRPELPFRLAALLRRRRAEVVHTHNHRPLVYAGAAASLARVPSIHTRHGQLTGVSSRQLKLVRWASRLTHDFVCVSEDAAARSKEQGLAPGRIACIPNGIDTRRFAFRGGNDAGPAVLVARLSPEKDIATLLRAAALVQREDPTFRLDIAGDGPCRPELETLARQLDPQGRLRFLGAVRGIPDLLAQARFFVLSSLSEGISLTLLEAMASGLAVAATRVGGNPEVVDEGTTGLLVPAGNPHALAGALARLHADGDLRRRFGAAGRQRVEERFDIRRMVARYEERYLRLPARLAGRRRRCASST